MWSDNSASRIITQFLRYGSGVVAGFQPAKNIASKWIVKFTAEIEIDISRTPCVRTLDLFRVPLIYAYDTLSVFAPWIRFRFISLFFFALLGPCVSGERR